MVELVDLLRLDTEQQERRGIAIEQSARMLSIANRSRVRWCSQYLDEAIVNKEIQSTGCNVIDIRLLVTRSHGSVRVLKDDRQSQWEMAKFDPQPTLNP